MHAACGHKDAPVAVGVHSPDPVAPVTHGGTITAVAVTEAGDAALTLDDLGGVRLWPSFDGKHPPLPVAVSGVEQLALGRTGDHFLAAFLSDAGDVLLLDLDRGGIVHARAQLPGDVACEQVIAIGDGVLVTRADQSIERYDALAHRRARIVAPAGERILAVAARRGGAVALLSDNAGRTTLARELVLGWGLTWGRSTQLPSDVTGRALALSPARSHVAVTRGAENVVQVFELETGDQVGPEMKLASSRVELGFTDDDHVAIVSSEIQWWPRKLAQASLLTTGAIGDGVAVGASGASLALATRGKLRYLGWSRSAIGELGVVDSRVLLVSGDTSAWLDDRLAVTSEGDVGGTDHTVWLDPRHVVRYGPERTNLVDLEHPDKMVRIADVTPQQVFYDPALHTLALYTYPGRIGRYVLDLDALTVTKLRTLEVTSDFPTGGHGAIDLLDPARSGGLVAIARWGDSPRVAFYREESAEPVVIRASHELSTAAVLAVDVTGALYYRQVPGGPIYKRRAGFDIELTGVTARALTPSHGAALLAGLDKHEISMFGTGGEKLWSRPLLAPIDAVFSGDDHIVIVQTAGGLMSFDATTGAPIAEACSFDFGLHDEPPVTNPLHADPICGQDDAGSTTRNVVPLPSSLSTAISPPMPAAMSRLIASPSPVPASVALVVKNGSKMFARSPGAIPLPLSPTSITTRPSGAVDVATRIQ